MRSIVDKRLFLDDSASLRDVELGLRQYREKSIPATRIHTHLYPSDVDALNEFIKEFKKRTGKRLTRSFILREGYPRFINYLKDLLAKAERGELHAKKREPAQPKAAPTSRKAQNKGSK